MSHYHWHVLQGRQAVPLCEWAGAREEDSTVSDAAGSTHHSFQWGLSPFCLHSSLSSLSHRPPLWYSVSLKDRRLAGEGGGGGRGGGRCLLVGCLTSQHHARASQGLISSDSCTCCHTEKVADHTQSQYTDTRPTNPSSDPILPGAWQDSPLDYQFLSHWYDSTHKNPHRESRNWTRVCHPWGGCLDQ